jgi:hypothetical protein
MLACPFAPHTCGDGQVAGQLTIPPQPSATGPHCLPVSAQLVAGVQVPPPGPWMLPPPQTFAWPPPPQICPCVAHEELPHDTVPPQPSAMLPQFIPAGHCVSGVHCGVPHMLAVPAPPQI